MPTDNDRQDSGSDRGARAATDPATRSARRWRSIAAWLSLYGGAALAGFGGYTLSQRLVAPQWGAATADGLGLFVAGGIIGLATRARQLWCRRGADFSTAARQLQDVIAAAPLAVYTVDRQDLVQTWNAAAERVFGFSAAEVIGHPLPIVPPEKQEEHNSIRDRTWSGQALNDLDVVRCRRDGTPVEVNLSISPMKDSHGRMVTAVAMAADITARRRAERALAESEARYDRIARNIPGMIYQFRMRTEQDRGFTYVSNGSRDVFGLEPEAFETDPNQLLRLLVPGDVADFLNTARDPSATANAWEGRFRHPQTGMIRWMSMARRARQAEDGATISDGIFTDVTALKEAEAAAREATMIAEAAREVAIAASAAKSAFLANVSHEIRTPLNGVIGMAELLTRKGGLTEQQLRYTSVIKSSGDALLSLINDVLDFSKIEAGKLELSPVDFNLRLAVEDVVEMLSPKAASKGLAFAASIAADCPSQVRGDVDRLRQVLINLVSNAIKFTAAGEVMIRVSAAPRPDGRAALRFAVSDTGTGISTEQASRLFKSFSQVDASTTRKYGGTGLGLAISKQLVDLMGGTIGVESEVGRGSTFSFTVPFAIATSTPPAVRAALRAPALRGLRILVVDDQPAYLEVLQDQLAFWGLDAHTAVGGPAGLAALVEAAQAGRPYRVALVDMIMPELDGPALAQRASADPRLAGTSMMLMTAMENPMDRDAMRASGFSSFLAKPVRQSALFDALVTTLDVPLIAPATEAAPTVPPTPASPAPAAASEPAVPAGSESITTAPLPVRSAPTPSMPLNATLLLVEDNLVNQEVAKELLETAGCKVDVASDGAAALEAVLQQNYDLVLMDCQMPVMDGFEAATRIRQWERDRGDASARSVPIIALTANAVQGDRDRCVAAGMNDYLTKPIDPDAMLATLTRYLPPRQMAAGSFPAAGATRAAPVAAPAREWAPVDVQSLLRRCSGKGELVERLLGKFAGSVQGQLDELAAALHSADWATMSRLAHTLKGASANLSAEGVRTVAAELEQTARTADAAAAHAALDRLAIQVRQCLAYMPKVGQEIRQQQEVPAPPAVSPSA